jgi:hypothetical protein
VENAPPVRDGTRPDISRADFTFCLLAIDWGWSMEEAAAQLMKDSTKAQKNGDAYALRTSQKAGAVIPGRGGRLGLTAQLPGASYATPLRGEDSVAKPKEKATKPKAADARKTGRPAIPKEWAQTGIMRGSELGPPRPRRKQVGEPRTSTLPHVESEDVIAIGEGGYAHFRRSRRNDQVQVTFSAPEGADTDPGQALTDLFEALGWTRRPRDPGQPWTFQLERSIREDPTARGDSRDVLHEQFLGIILEYREKCGMPPLEGAKGWSR